MNPQFSMNSFASQSEVIMIPDRMVGLIIGKGGDQVTSIQNESDCKIQFAPAENNGMLERACTLTGAPESILKAKELINRIMNKGHDYPPGVFGGGAGGPMMEPQFDGMGGGGPQMVEMMIPGNKAGIIIGKGGDTIKQLQERAGVRMVIIQDTNSPTNYDKPLRITGDRQSCQRARDMVMALLAEKDLPPTQGGGGPGGFNDFGQRQTLDLQVPRSMIGIVIGKGGEMIKKLQQDSGARIQFKPDDEMGGPSRVCSIMGNMEQTQTAANMIQEIIDNSMQRQGLGDGWGSGRPQRGGGVNMDGMGGGKKFGNGSLGGGDETTYSVPADKCGLVIGKGGETIREICRQSGAHVELNRELSAASAERVFRIQGSPDQIRAAIQIVAEKAGMPPPNDAQLGGGVPGGNGALPMNAGSMPGGGGAMPGQAGGMVNVGGGMAAMLAGQQPTVAGMYGQQPGVVNQQQPQAQQQQFAAVQAAAAAQYQQYPAATASVAAQYNQAAAGQAAIGNDLNKQALEANAAWAAYCQQYYNQQQLGGAAAQPNALATATAVASLQQQQQQQQQQQYAALLPRTSVTPQSMALAGLGGGAVQQAQPAAIATAAAAPDYTAAWAEYYRQHGLHQQAQAILLQSAAAGLQGLQQQPQ